MICVVDSTDTTFWGPYTKPILADKVLKIVKQAIDPDAEIVSVDCDPWEDQLNAGLLPVKITLEIVGNRPKEPQVDVFWPPEEKEGLILNLVGYREYFFWVHNRSEAIIKMARIVPPPPEKVSAKDDLLLEA